MEESMEKLLKELLQKKLHGTLTSDEELILSDLVERKRGGVDISSPSFRTPGLGALNNLINDTEALNSSLDEMANKIRNRTGQSEAKQTMAEEDKKKK